MADSVHIYPGEKGGCHYETMQPVQHDNYIETITRKISQRIYALSMQFFMMSFFMFSGNTDREKGIYRHEQI